MTFYERILAFLMSIIAIFTGVNSGVQQAKPIRNNDFTYLEYSTDAVKTLKSAGLTVESYTARADANGTDYEQAQGYDDINGIIPSPYFKIYVGSKKVPAYATTAFVGTTQSGELHSFSEIYVADKSDFNFQMQLNTTAISISSVTIFPRNKTYDYTFTNNVLNFKIEDYGTYTFLFNGDDQAHSFTLFVRPQVNDQAIIDMLVGQYGADNVTVFEPGLHKLDYISITQNSAIYMKPGAYLLANHKYDIMSDADDQATVEDGASSNNGIGLSRYPFINVYGVSSVKIYGYGAIDMSHLDRHERRGMVFTFSQNIEVNGPKIINCPEWSFITYQCDNVSVVNTDIFGYKQNSDAYAICNSRNVTVDNSFCRSGDDLFDVKTLGGDENAVSRNVTFTNCYAWAGKARCFGICGEINKPISDITFRDCTVIYHDATWDTNRITALAIIAEQGGGSIDNLTYENIDIYCAKGRAIGCLIYGSDVENLSITNITYKNINYTSALPNKFTSNSMTTNTIQASLSGIYCNGMPVNTLSTDYFEYDSYANITVS